MNEIVLSIHPYEKRLAILEDSRLMELVVERRDQENIIHNIYKGTVKDILPGMGAAFINIGLERTAFLHYSDIVTDFFDDADEEAPQKIRSDGKSSRIKDILKEGQEIIVQVKKGPIHKKGARLTCQISIPGKYLVLFPNKTKIAISRKIYSGAEKNRIKNILQKIKDKNVGLIVRTDAEGNSEEEFMSEYQGLFRTWQLIEHKIQTAEPPSCIYDDNDLANKLIRDFFSSSVDRLVVDDKKFLKQLVSDLKDIAPDMAKRTELYREDSPIFDAFGIEKEIEKMFHSRVPLPSGGNIVIEETEALVSIDVNTGSFTGHRNYETTVKKTNTEAAIELARQIRLRDLSGIMVVDFIDMESEANKSEVFEIFKKHLRKDRAKNKAFFFDALGLVEVTRKKTGPGLLNTYSEQCPHCNGTGRFLSREAIALNIYRSLQRTEYYAANKNVRLVLHSAMNDFLLQHPGYFKGLRLHIEIEVEPSFARNQFKVFY
jgi:ribonuclease G